MVVEGSLRDPGAIAFSVWKGIPKSAYSGVFTEGTPIKIEAWGTSALEMFRRSATILLHQIFAPPDRGFAELRATHRLSGRK